jgi:hypothetical protein
MSDIRRPHLYYGCEKLKYYLTPSPADFLTRRAALTTNSIGSQPSHKGEGGGGGSSLHNLLMSMPYSEGVLKVFAKIFVFAKVFAKIFVCAKIFAKISAKKLWKSLVKIWVCQKVKFLRKFLKKFSFSRKFSRKFSLQFSFSRKFSLQCSFSRKFSRKFLPKNCEKVWSKYDYTKK